MADTISDLQLTKMKAFLDTVPVAYGVNDSLQDISFAYYKSRSGLAGPATVSDYEKAYYTLITGVTTGSISDLEREFYDFKLVPAGSLSDRAYFWWSGVIT